MKKVKDFNYYGRKRLRVQRFLKFFNEEKFSMLYIFIPLCIGALIFDIESNFSFTFSSTGGVIGFIFFGYAFYYIFSMLAYILCLYLDKYYFKKRKELLDSYIEGINSAKE